MAWADVLGLALAVIGVVGPYVIHWYWERLGAGESYHAGPYDTGYRERR